MANTATRTKGQRGAAPEDARLHRLLRTLEDLIAAEPAAQRPYKEITRRLPAWKRRAMLRAVFVWGLRQVDERPADAIREFGT